MPLNPEENDQLGMLWNSDSAKGVSEFVILHEDESLTLTIGDCYLFSHPGQKKRRGQDIDSYWKGVVTEIKKLPSRDDALVKVCWFWSKQDIKQAIQGKRVDKKLRLILGAAAQNELFPGLEEVINSSEAIESDIDVVHLTDNVDQEPVIEYFFRFVWDEHQKIIRGPPSGCAIDMCHQIWNPEEEEQRYCYTCMKWCHSACLLISRGTTQETIVKQLQMALQEQGSAMVPETLLCLAYQPIARGGPRHFTAGNIRIVKKARDLVEEEETRQIFTGGMGGMTWSEDEWIASFENYFGFLAKDRGDMDAEQVIDTAAGELGYITCDPSLYESVKGCVCETKSPPA
ncbi:hypothetical protein CVT25_001658 [Psilocybe cyanescens]|uniref:BAH domain-containing protein n=1 Tax=Psilocybe cyanescens TaxID=93625 RepID=A0A409XHG8_PSICY|nr:hypothetical protein CVT25_001658 [Psilocybe cyanescens]